MPARVGIVVAGETSVRAIAARSRGSLDRPLASDAELWIAVAAQGESARVLGAFQRGPAAPADLPLLRRGSGGPDVIVAPSTIHVALVLAHPAVLLAADERRIVNRYVRPLLRALSKRGAGPAHFFGRDWISVAGVPVGWVGFGHDATTRRTLFEAFVGVRTPFAVAGRAALRGRSPASLEAVAGRSLDPQRIAAAICDAYSSVGAEAVALAPPPSPPVGPRDDDARMDPPWAATVDEAIGVVGAGPDARGAFRVGGDLLVSRDALARLETRAADAAIADVGGIVHDTLTAPGVALDGVRSLASVGDVIVRARLEQPSTM